MARGVEGWESPGGDPQSGLADPARALCEKERLFAIRYGAERPPNPLAGEDLESEDLADAEHWVRVYGELVAYVHQLSDTCSEEANLDPARAEDRPENRRAIRLKAKVQELHLAFWTDRRNRLRVGP